MSFSLSRLSARFALAFVIAAVVVSVSASFCSVCGITVVDVTTLHNISGGQQSTYCMSTSAGSLCADYNTASCNSIPCANPGSGWVCPSGSKGVEPVAGYGDECVRAAFGFDGCLDGEHVTCYEDVQCGTGCTTILAIGPVCIPGTHIKWGTFISSTASGKKCPQNYP